ncbi:MULTISPECIES: LysR family transcriptional regulator [unclassified Herbaspirillum]|uniref:LysR family transcriptional regulator n=1 Tax=unclassified Herbaspirillum TaxID=2624150 RepID=UPI000E2F8FBD|nr:MULTISPECIES: LysR family transcriptional regulator [unclassified Herbaspirillum]RFB71209.1 LysR family transcriptional regulator [Herbaspirillum sp. 3R-3a1]TFI08254.1 LysR family transcriptional regulator [Herbaspirillum sp. 3R11]TFI14669.1 LysR family transcriptional regulator [Herbaspirillum sp. 3R-11]TFI31939.1 LysR family transcriptional regulator [Herbaspirillum sp. 3C11]TFI31978.1 LysR family transcriptional regulator [Herbaspirillum sp. 3C11]
MDRIQAMSAFLAVVDTEGFSAAARKLKVSPSVITRAVTELEERLGVRLLTRTTRFVRLTDTGRVYAENCRRILAELDDADSTATGAHSTPKGQFTVTATVGFGCMHVAPVVRDYLTLYPEVDIHCWFIDRNVNLVDEGVDVAVRIGALPDSSLQAIPVGRVRQVLCAAPAYLQQHGVPQCPEDLSGHVIVTASGITPTPELRFRDDLKIRIHPRMTTTTNDSAAAMAVAGFGITRLPLYQVAPALQRGELELLLEDFERPAMPIHVVHREGHNATRKLRTFIDMTVEALRRDESLQ